MSAGLATRRAWVVAALLVVGALDLHSTAVGLRAHTRLRARTLSDVRQSALQARARVAPVLADGGAEVMARAAAMLVDAGLGASAELFRTDGTRLAAVPARSPSPHWPTAREMALLQAGEAIAITQLASPPPRVFGYVVVPVPAAPAVVVRLSSDAADLVADLRDRQEAFVAQAIALLLVLATVALVAPPRAETAPVDAPALEAYEEAMDRLRARDEETTRRHRDERHRMEGELREQEPFVRAGELTVGIVHEIRNGLGTILGYARLIEKAGGATGEHARGIVEECETLETVVRRFMEFVKDDSLRPEPFDLERMLRRVVARESRARPGAETAIQGAAGLVVADEDVLERAFENLVRNAREAAGAHGHVWIALERGPDAAVVTVADDGPGMPAEVRSRLRPFFTTKSGGLGLGLPLAFKIVQRHGGDLTLADRAPRGLAVRVRLPLVRSAASVADTERNQGGLARGVRGPTSVDESHDR